MAEGAKYLYFLECLMNPKEISGEVVPELKTPHVGAEPPLWVHLQENQPPSIM